MNRGETFLLGMTIGAGLTYLLDPERGARRRSLLRDQLVHAGHELEETTRSGARHARNRAAGLAHEIRAGLTERDVEDRVLEERVRSEAGRLLSDAKQFHVAARDGRVTLSGLVDAREVQDVVRAVRGVRGVAAVDNRLEVLSASGTGNGGDADRHG